MFLRAHYTVHGPLRVPVDTFPLWRLVRECLDPKHGKHNGLIDTQVKTYAEAQMESSAPLEPMLKDEPLPEEYQRELEDGMKV